MTPEVVLPRLTKLTKMTKLKSPKPLPAVADPVVAAERDPQAVVWVVANLVALVGFLVAPGGPGGSGPRSKTVAIFKRPTGDRVRVLSVTGGSVNGVTSFNMDMPGGGQARALVYKDENGKPVVKRAEIGEKPTDIIEPPQFKSEVIRLKAGKADAIADQVTKAIAAKGLKGVKVWSPPGSSIIRVEGQTEDVEKLKAVLKLMEANAAKGNTALAEPLLSLGIGKAAPGSSSEVKKSEVSDVVIDLPGGAETNPATQELLGKIRVANPSGVGPAELPLNYAIFNSKLILPAVDAATAERVKKLCLAVFGDAKPATIPPQPMP